MGNNKTWHTLQRERRKKSVDYSNKPFDDFRLINVDLPKKLANEKLKFISASFGLSTENQSKLFISKRVLTHVLNNWDESKTWYNPSSTDTYPSIHISLKVFYITMK